MRLVGAFVIAGLLAGCSAIQNGTNALSGGARQSFDGKFYRARLAKDDVTPERFTVTVGRAAQGIEGAKEAGRYEATKYCLKNFGWTGIEWTVGPDQPVETLVLTDGSLILTGECKGWV